MGCMCPIILNPTNVMCVLRDVPLREPSKFTHTPTLEKNLLSANCVLLQQQTKETFLLTLGVFIKASKGRSELGMLLCNKTELPPVGPDSFFSLSFATAD